MLQLLAMALSLKRKTLLALNAQRAQQCHTCRALLQAVALCTGQRLCSTTALRGGLTFKRSAVYNTAL
eukprot:3009-Heterococcus_DN1.PRE.5